MYLPHLQCHAAARFSVHLDAFMVRGVDKRFGVANIILQNDARVSKQKKKAKSEQALVRFIAMNTICDILYRVY